MKKIFFIAIFLILILRPALADSIYLKSGQIVSGSIIEESEKYLRIDIGGGIILRYYFDEIEKVQRDAPAGSVTPILEPAASEKFQEKGAPAESTKAQGQKLSLPEKLSQTAVDSGPTQDREAVSESVTKYLQLVSQASLIYNTESKALLESFKGILDFDNMPAYASFKSTLEKARSQGPQMAAGSLSEDSLRQRFLISHILNLRSTRLKQPDRSKLEAASKILDIGFSEDLNRAIVGVGVGNVNLLKIKLHKIASQWLIYSVD